MLAGGHSADRPQRSGWPGAGRAARALPDWPTDGVRRLRRPPLPGLLAEGRPGAPASSTRGSSATPTRQAAPLATEVATDAFRGVTELTVLAPDHPRLLAIITGACAAAGAQHRRRADLHHHRRPGARHDLRSRAPSTWTRTSCAGRARIAHAIEQALKGEIRIAEAVAGKRPGRSASAETFHVAPDVVIDNALSTRHTVVEVTGLDRPGLLYELTTALSASSTSTSPRPISRLSARRRSTCSM